MATVFPVGTRNPGVSISAEQVVPAGAAGKKWFLHITGMSQADLDNTSIHFDLRMYKKKGDGSYDPMVAYDGTNPEVRNAGGVVFDGAPNKGKNNTVTLPPGWYAEGNDFAGQTVKFWLNVTGIAFNAGLDADVV